MLSDYKDDTRHPTISYSAMVNHNFAAAAAAAAAVDAGRVGRQKVEH